MRKTVEETLKAQLDEEVPGLVEVERCERTAGREAWRSGHYARKLVTGAGEVDLSVAKLRGATFRTAVIERYHGRETSVEEAIVEMHLAGVSARGGIEDVSELLWGGRRCPLALSPTSTRGPSRPSRPDGRGRSTAAIPTFSSTASTSSAAGEDATRTLPSRSPTASSPPATGTA